MPIDPFRLCIAFGPLAVYCLLLGVIHLRRRPWLTTGAQDMALLAAGTSGLFVIGPMELFLPEAAATRFGVFVWILMLAFYGLVVSFLGLISRPRLIVYNVSVEQARPLLSELALEIDADARWAGENLALPNLGVQLHLDSFPAMHNLSLVASGEHQDFAGWRKLQLGLAERLDELPGRNPGRGVGLIACGMLMLIGCLFYSLGDPQALAQGFRQMLRL